MSALQLRRATSEDTNGLVAMFSSVFDSNPKADATILRWQYWSNPFGDAVSHVWVDGERIVSHCARIPVPVLFEGTPAMAAFGAEATTAPEYSGQGLYTSARAAADLESCERGLLATFSFRAPGSPLPKTSAPVSAPLRHFVRP